MRTTRRGAPSCAKVTPKLFVRPTCARRPRAGGPCLCLRERVRGALCEPTACCAPASPLPGGPHDHVLPSRCRGEAARVPHLRPPCCRQPSLRGALPCFPLCWFVRALLSSATRHVCCCLCPSSHTPSCGLTALQMCVRALPKGIEEKFVLPAPPVRFAAALPPPWQLTQPRNPEHTCFAGTNAWLCSHVASVPRLGHCVC